MTDEARPTGDSSTLPCEWCDKPVTKTGSYANQYGPGWERRWCSTDCLDRWQEENE